MAASYAGFAGAAIKRTGNKEGTAKGGSKSHAARRGRLSLAFPREPDSLYVGASKAGASTRQGRGTTGFHMVCAPYEKEHKYFLSTICIVESGKAR